MTLILLEALAALGVLLFIVWWTMFAGRKKGELPGQHDAATSSAKPPVPKTDSDAAAKD